MTDLLDAFLSEVQKHPALTAVEHDGVATSYAELDDLARRIAGCVRQVVSTPSPRLLLALPPSPMAYASMIATLQLGGTFCPVNIDGPEARNALITRSFSPDVVLFNRTPSSFLDDLPATTP